MIVYQHQSTYLLITNEYSINPHNHSQFITFFVTSFHLYEFNILLPIKIKSNVYVIIECERTQTTTNVMHYLQQPLSASQDVTTQLVLESGWVSFTNSNTHHLNSHHHLTFSKNCWTGTIPNHSTHVKLLCSKKSDKTLYLSWLSFINVQKIERSNLSYNSLRQYSTSMLAYNGIPDLKTWLF